jgi:hypothetical protein
MEEIFKIRDEVSNGEIDTNEAFWQVLDLLVVSGMFSSDKLEQAYKDGVRDALTKGYGTFNEENYR